ncbi:MAG: GIY-YIG nuclease family protein [Patescibacteria group bacterium]
MIKNKFVNHFVYILKCADSSLYTGYTTDLKKRVGQHNTSKRGARYTKSRRPVALVYSEKYKTKSKALKREIEIKSWSRKKKLVLIGSGL